MVEGIEWSDRAVELIDVIEDDRKDFLNSDILWDSLLIYDDDQFYKQPNQQRYQKEFDRLL